MRRDKPDFICIGPTKTGTTWLYRQLLKFPGVDIPYKEMYYYWGLKKEPHSEINYARVIRETMSAGRKEYRALMRQRGTDLSLNAFRQLLWDLRFLYGKRSPRWYGSLYQKEMLSGDMNALLYLLEENQIKKIFAHLPHLRVIMHFRDPVQRVWSNINMVNQFTGQPALHAQDPETIRKRILWNYHTVPSYVVLLRRWRSVFPAEQVLVNYYDDISFRPVYVLQCTADFLGLSMAGFQGDDVTLRAIVKPTIKEHMPSDIKSYLISLFKPSVEDLAAHTDSPYPRQWLADYAGL